MVGKKATQNYCRCRIFPLPNSLLPIFPLAVFFRCLFSFPLLHTLILCFPTCFPTRLFFVADFSGSPIFPVAVSSIAVFSCLFSVAIFTVAVLSWIVLLLHAAVDGERSSPVEVVYVKSPKLPPKGKSRLYEYCSLEVLDSLKEFYRRNGLVYHSMIVCCKCKCNFLYW